MAKGSILVTGANGGLGSGFVTQLLKSPYAKDYNGIYTVRNPNTAHELQTATQKAPESHTFEILPLDLISLKAVRAAATDINARVASGALPPLRALILNAAFQEANASTLSAQTYTHDGYEATFGVNYLANFLFVLLLLQSMDREHGRIVIIASCTHDVDNPHNLTYYKEEKYRVMFAGAEELAKGVVYRDGSGYDAGMRRYGASKLLAVMFMYELQRRLDVDPDLSKISVISVDPGGMATRLSRRGPLWILFITRILMPTLEAIISLFTPNGFLRTTKKSGGDVLKACFDEDTLGEYPKAVYLDGTRRAESSKESMDVEKQKTLWADSLKLAAIKDGDTVLKNYD